MEPRDKLAMGPCCDICESYDNGCDHACKVARDRRGTKRVARNIGGAKGSGLPLEPKCTYRLFERCECPNSEKFKPVIVASTK